MGRESDLEKTALPLPVRDPQSWKANPKTPWAVPEADRELLSQLALALWWDPVQARNRGCEALAATSLGEDLPEVLIERASGLLLNWCEQEEGDAGAPKLGLEGAFWRLPPKARFVLAVLHGTYRWSWRRTARVFGWAASFETGTTATVERMREISGELLDLVARLAWSSRLELAWELGRGYPSGGGSADITRNCPEMDARAPWTQKFLDEEMQPRELLFLQNHLMACSSCRGALDLARNVFHGVDAHVRGIFAEERTLAGGVQVGRSAVSKAFAGVLESRRLIFRPASLSFGESLRVHFSRSENQVLWTGALLLLIGAAWLS
jgi:hypothetical protein